MKSRISLLLIIVSLWLFLFIFQNYMPTFWAILFLLSFMVLYALYMHISFKHQKRKLRKCPLILKDDYRPFVSIMIPAHNEASVIEGTVENVLRLNYFNYEIILIDDRSDDNTAAVVMKLAQKYKTVTPLIRDKNAFPGKSAVLNEALTLAKGEAILVLDADARISPNFILDLLPYFEPAEVGAVQARKCISNRDYNILTRCQDNEFALDTHFQVGRDAVKGAVELRGDGELLKRKAIEDIGGWNNYTITDDLDMSTRLQIKGWDVRFCANVCVYEEGVSAFIPLLKQRRRWIEGSIRRYLENMKDVIFSKDISLRVTVDMIAYITEFILPFWLMSELFFQIFKYARDNSNNLSSSLIVASTLGVFFMLGLIYSLKKYNKLSFSQSIKQSFETCIYFVLIWYPLVIYIIPKIIFFKKSLAWGKTAHGTTKCHFTINEQRHSQVQEEKVLVNSKG